MNNQSYHFVGIGGIGMSALARIALGKGAKVSGSDMAATDLLSKLRNDGAKIYQGHAKENIDQTSTLVYSSAVKEDNPEMIQAKALACPVMHRSELLGVLMEGQKSLLVAGTHGKTSTSGLLAHVLKSAHLAPSYAIGGIVKNYGSNGGFGEGDYFVAEADESDGSFLKYSGHGAILLNVDADHLDHWGDFKAICDGFSTFSSQVENSDLLFWCRDDDILTKMALPGVSYGFSDEAALRAINIAVVDGQMRFDITFEGEEYRGVFFPLLGKHHVCNALAVFGMALRLGVSEEVIRNAFISFAGMGRRLDLIAEVQNTAIYDDYAHHPKEVKETLSGLKKGIDGRRLVAVLQPHRYSRTEACFDAWPEALNAADEIVITDVHSAGEGPIDGISGELLVRHVEKLLGRKASYFPRNDLVDHLSKKVRVHDVVIMMGAGDVTKAAKELGNHLSQNGVIKYQIGALYGGRSNENSISITSSKGVIPHLEKELYDVTPFCILQSGKWECGKNGELLDIREAMGRLQECDVVLPILHGPNGEDGTMQGFCEILNLPYVGSGVCASSVCMNKGMVKKVAAHHSIKIAPFLEFNEFQWEKSPEQVREEICEKLSFPLFVKPSRMGSSLGMSLVTTKDNLFEALEKGVSIDHQIVVEEKIVGREIEIAILGNQTLTVGSPGELYTKGAFYDYESKYGAHAIGSTVDVDIDLALLDEVKQQAQKLYRAIDCRGLCRIDFFLTPEKKWVFNEANPLPGFTPISLYPKMLDDAGVDYSTLLNKLIIYALESHRRRNVKLERSFNVV